ncbi:MAG TPA: 3-oxoacyl-ACP reductase [Nannocystaceae bacterium]|nr:3-oxoacyl-ACP reductase [Nannocystaceae bacterium]
MSDFLLENQAARKLIQTLGLPVPVPTRLRRADGPVDERPLHDDDVVVGQFTDNDAIADVLARTLTSAGASPQVTTPALQRAFAAPGEAFGRPAKLVDPAAEGAGRVRSLVFDATGLSDPGQLRALYDFFHPLVVRVKNCGRALVIGRPPGSFESANAAAAHAALEGFVRSLAKELGKRGSTAQLLYVDKGAEDRLEGPLRFLLSDRSAFVSGQPLTVTADTKAPSHPKWVRALQGKIALVTGAARGIGEATAELLAAEGAHVVCLDRPQDDALLSQVARKVGGSLLLADLGTPDVASTVVSELKTKHGGVDIVVHNAGITRDKTLAKMKPEAWDQAIDVNLQAVTKITAALLEGTLKNEGRVICLSSVAGIAGNMGQTNYAASKAGLIGWVSRMAKHTAARGITVNAIAPGFIETRLTAAIPVMIREAGRRLSNLGQGGLPQDVGEAIAFLASPGAVGITGQVLRVCGGALIGR